MAANIALVNEVKKLAEVEREIESQLEVMQITSLLSKLMLVTGGCTSENVITFDKIERLKKT